MSNKINKNCKSRNYKKNKQINQKISEKGKTIIDYENRINNSKSKLINLINKENYIREKIHFCNNQVKALELKLE